MFQAGWVEDRQRRGVRPHAAFDQHLTDSDMTRWSPNVSLLSSGRISKGRETK
jgi:hypothetical protein